MYVAPGNDGMRDCAELVAIDSMDFESLANFAKEQGIDLTFVGPEQPLAEGIVDYFQERGLVIFGPTKQATQIEGSKSFAKQLMKNTTSQQQLMKRLLRWIKRLNILNNKGHRLL